MCRCTAVLIAAVLLLIVLQVIQFLSPVGPNELSLSNILKIPPAKTADTKVVMFFSHNYSIIPDYGVKALIMYEVYCKRHGYDFYCFNHRHDSNQISPYWIRVADFVRLAEMYPLNTLFVYMDFDTCINPRYLNLAVPDLVSRIENLTQTEYDMFIGADPQYELNSGVIIAKNTDWTKHFMKTWYQKYNAAQWLRDVNRNKWTCVQEDRPCTWAENGFEQGAINIMYANNELNCTNHILPLHSSVMSTNQPFTDAFIYHFMTQRQFWKPMCMNRMFKKFLQAT